MRTLSLLFILVIALLAPVQANAVDETTKTAETTAVRLTVHTGCGGDDACAAAHGLPAGSPITCEEDEGDARVCGNREAGVGDEHGPRGTRCDAGGTYVASNDAGQRVCRY